MAIFEAKCYGVECDICKDVYVNEYSGLSVWVDDDSAIEEAQEDGWLIEDGKCYCPNCYEIDEEDKVVIKSDRLEGKK